MSLTFNDNSSAFLVLDFGLYSSSKELKYLLKNDKKNHILELKPNQLKSTDWDHVLDLIIKNKKCITL